MKVDSVASCRSSEFCPWVSFSRSTHSTPPPPEWPLIPTHPSKVEPWQDQLPGWGAGGVAPVSSFTLILFISPPKALFSPFPSC